MVVAGVGVSFGADMPVKAPRPATVFAPGPLVNPFAGGTVVPDAYYVEAGAVFGIHHDLNSDGWLFRIKAGGGEYEYNLTAATKQSASFQTFDAMIGYQKFVGDVRWTGYIGLNVENHDNSDVLAKVRGTEAGAKFQGEVFAPLGGGWYALGVASYSTVWNSYFTQAKLGVPVTPTISVGPEVAALGNDRFSAVRTGPFVAFEITSSVQLILSGGYTWDTKTDPLNDHSGGYGVVHIRGLI